MSADLLTAREVADRLGFRTETVLRWARDGELPSLKVRRAVRFREVDVEAWLSEQERATPTRGVLATPNGAAQRLGYLPLATPDHEEI